MHKFVTALARPKYHDCIRFVCYIYYYDSRCLSNLVRICLILRLILTLKNSIIISRNMKLFAILALLRLGVEAARGVCNSRVCGCPPYWYPWCTEGNARIHHHVCQESRKNCEYYCDERWCPGDAPKPAPAPAPSPTPPPIKVFEHMSSYF